MSKKPVTIKLPGGNLPGASVEAHRQRFGHLPNSDYCDEEGTCTTPCYACGKPYGEHDDKQGSMRSRLPCLGIKSGYRPRRAEGGVMERELKGRKIGKDAHGYYIRENNYGAFHRIEPMLAGELLWKVAGERDALKEE